MAAPAEDAVRMVNIEGLGEVCDICMGTMTFTAQEKVQSDEACFAVCNKYVELGGNFFDTAEVYPFPMNPELMGGVERQLGRWLQTEEAPERSAIKIATKVAGYIPAPLVSTLRCKTLGLEDTEIFPNTEFNEAQIRQAIAASLARLQTDYVDLYQLHWPDRYVPLWGKSEYKGAMARAHQHNPALDRELTDEYYEEVVRTMAALMEEGKIRAWGLSNETSFGVCKWCSTADRLGLPRPATIQNDFSLCDRRFETELAETCSYYGVQLICYGALNGGFLSDKYFGENPVKKGSRHTTFAPGAQARYAEVERTRPAAQKYYELAQSKGLSLAVMAYAWARSRFYMGSVIVGVSCLEHVSEIMEVAAKTTLDEDTLREIDTIHFYHPSPNAGEKPVDPSEEKETGLSLQRNENEEAEETPAAAEENAD